MAMNDDDSAIAPVEPARVLGREAKVVRKRFYKTVAVAAQEVGFVIHLDGRAVRTPRKLLLALRVLPLAEQVAAEWDAQATEILPSTMPLTTLACTAIDAVANQMQAVAAEISRYAMSDLLCYRADAPAELVAQQAAGWDPVLAAAENEMRVTFKRTIGVSHVAQSPDVETATLAALAPLDPLQLAAVHVLTSLTGSALLALAVLRRRLSLDDAWSLAHIDEDWQIARWGTDAEAEARRANRYRTAAAAACVLDMLRA